MSVIPVMTPFKADVWLETRATANSNLSLSLFNSFMWPGKIQFSSKIWSRDWSEPSAGCGSGTVIMVLLPWSGFLTRFSTLAGRCVLPLILVIILGCHIKIYLRFTNKVCHHGVNINRVNGGFSLPEDRYFRFSVSNFLAIKLCNESHFHHLILDLSPDASSGRITIHDGSWGLYVTGSAISGALEYGGCLGCGSVSHLSRSIHSYQDVINCPE